MDIIKQIAMFLSGKGIGTFDESGLSGNIFIETLPDKPDIAIGVFSTGGPQSDPLDEYVIQAFQIIIRTIPEDPRPGKDVVRAIIDELHGFNSGYLTEGGNYIFDTIAIQSGANNIGQDPVGRFEYSQNFTIEYLKEEN